MELLYYGKKEKMGPCQVLIQEEHSNGTLTQHTLEHIKRHSIDGFQWGYGGSGPSDLALSILTDYCKRFNIEDTEIPNKFYQRFKDNFLSNSKESLAITSIQIKEWLENVQINKSIVEKHKEFIKIARNEALTLSSNRYFEMKYEDFIGSPHTYMDRLLDFSDLRESGKVHKYIDKYSRFANQNYKYLKSIKTTDIEMINKITSELLSELKYQIH